jgi:hypothetical protein
MLKGIEFARRRDWPFLGTCGGFQYAFIEFARNVLGIKDADSAENNSGSKNIIIYPVACAVPTARKTLPNFRARSRRSACGPALTCNRSTARTRKLRPRNSSATSKSIPTTNGPPWKPDFPWSRAVRKGEIRAIESPTHRFFLATLFQPQLSSTEKKPHPIVLALCKPPPTGARKSWTTACWSNLRIWSPVALPATLIRIVTCSRDRVRRSSSHPCTCS